MMLNLLQVSRRKKILAGAIFSCCAGLLLASCNKSGDEPGPGTGIIVSETGSIEEPIDKLDLPAEGGKDTIYVYSNTQTEVKVNESVDWVKIISQQYNERSRSTTVVLQADDVGEDLAQRIGELDISNQSMYSRKFLTLTQGYKTHFSDDFSWLHYGQGNPLDLDEGVLIGNWNLAQKNYGWISDTLEGKDNAYVYGKAGYVQLGNDTAGANLLTPVQTGVQNDSLIVVTFNAVAFVSAGGQKDGNSLTVKVIGGTFGDGKDTKTIELNYIDYTSALIETNMWDDSWYNLVVHKLPADPYSTTLQVEFIGGDGEAAPSNRVFLDNVRIFSRQQYAPQQNDD